MCTLSLLPSPGSLRVWMNRDESPARGASAKELSQGETAGIKHVYPLDPPSGGTWIGVNARGLLLALLNEYPGGRSGPRAPRSRGELIPMALGEKEPTGAAHALERLDPRLFGPCVVVLAGLEGSFRILRSDGQRWTQETRTREPAVFVSSGVDALGARRSREALFEKALALGPPGLANFHRSHEPEQGPLSPCMHRSAARSVSHCSVVADGQGVEMSYWPLPPCEIEGREPLKAFLP